MSRFRTIKRWLVKILTQRTGTWIGTPRQKR